MSTMDLGIGSYTFGWAVGVPDDLPPRPMDEHGLLDKAIELGVTVVQICDNLPLHTFSRDRLDTLVARAAQEGVRLEIGARRLTVGRIREYVEICHRLNASLLRFVIDDVKYEPTSAEVVAILREAVASLGGVTLALENHDRFPAAALRHIVEEVGSTDVGICLDTANSLGAGEGLETVMAQLAPLTVNLHIKDFAIRRVPYLMGLEVQGRPAGDGQVQLAPLLASLAPLNRCHTAILELWTPPEHNRQQTIAKEQKWAEQSLRYLRGYFPVAEDIGEGMTRQSTETARGVDDGLN